MMRPLLLRAAAALAVALIVAALASLAPPSPAVRPCAGAGSNHAAIVVQHANGSVETRCVAFAGETVTGQQLLEQSGLSWSGKTFGGFGVAVCALDGEPASYSSCPGADYYWAVFVSHGGAAWQLSAVGISQLTLRDGDLEGFRYVPASGTPGPPALPSGICAAATSLPSRAAPPPSNGGTASPTSPTAATASVSGGTPQTEASASPAPGATVPSPLPTPIPPIGPAAPPAGLDAGLLAAAIAAGGLAGLAILRLGPTRRRPK